MSDNNQTAKSKPTSTPANSGEEVQPCVVLRHDGGLSAGNTLGLRPGRYEFGPTIGQSGGLSSGKPSVVGFELLIAADQDAKLTPKDVDVLIDGRKVTEPVSVKPGQVIQAGADFFSLGEPDSFIELAKRERSDIQVSRVHPPQIRPALPRLLVLALLALIVLGIVLGIVNRSGWFALSAGAALLGAFIWWSRRRKNRKAQTTHDEDLSRAQSSLGEAISTERNLVARQCRAAHPSPTTMQRLIEARTESETDTHSAGGSSQVSLGLCDVAWAPPVRDRDDAGWDYQSVLDEHNNLAAVPLLIKPADGLIIVTGTSDATAAVGRYLDQFADQDRDQAYVLLEDAENLPSDYNVLVQIQPNGFATAVDKDGTTLASNLVPNGLPATEIQHFNIAGQTDADVSDTDVSDTPAENVAGENVAVEKLADLGDDDAEQAPLPALELPEIAPKGELAGLLLYTSDDRSESKAGLATLGLNLTEQRPASAMALTILDAGDRGLIRLRQLPHCVGYATIDDDEGARLALAGLDAALEDRSRTTQVVLISEFPRLLAFLRLSGRDLLADRLTQLSKRSSNDELVMLASATTDSPNGHTEPITDRDMTEGVVSQAH